VLFFIIYGTKRRARTFGALALECAACTGVRRHFAVSIEESAHVYWIPLGYSPVGQVAVCDGCAANVDLPPSLPTVDAEASQNMAMDDLIAATNPGLRATRMTEIQVDRENYVRRSLASQLQGLDQIRRHAESEGSPGRLLMLAAFTGAAFVTSAIGGMGLGIAMAVTLLLLFVEIRRAMKDRVAAREVLPRLKRLLEEPDVTMDRINRTADLPKLSRLLRSRPFDTLQVRVEKL